MSVTQPQAEVIVAFIALLGTLVGLYIQNRRVHRDNRNDHHQTMANVKTLTDTVHSIHADVLDTKADVRIIKTTLVDHEHRLDDLEDPDGS